MNTTRRRFFKHMALGTLGIGMLPQWACNTSTDSSDGSKESTTPMEPFFKISLAQWSLHRAIEKKEIDPIDFASISKNQFDIDAIEYVASFYLGKAEDTDYLNELKKRASDNGVKSLLIMVDEHGDLGSSDEAERIKAVENHYQWVDAAAYLDCHSIRVNAFGDGSRSEVQAAMVDGLGRLSTYAKDANINVLVENHGLFSSDGQWVSEVMEQVNMPNCGTLPDFGNFCTGRKWGNNRDGKCPEQYDRYKGIEELMRYTINGVSAKSYDFDEAGNETVIDYARMLKIVKAAGFDGYIGVEYEGDELSEPEGIIATRDLLRKLGAEMG